MAITRVENEGVTAPEASMSNAALAEFKRYVREVCSSDAAILQMRTERIESGDIISYVVKACLSTAADPKVAYIVVRLVRSFRRGTLAPVTLFSNRLPEERIHVRPWNWSRSVRLTGLDGFDGSWELYRTVVDRVWVGVLARLLAA